MSSSPSAASGARRRPVGGWRWVRAGGRWSRRACLLLVLGVLGLGLFLNHVGLPEPVKRQVVAQLRQQGWAVEFSRLRLRWYRGLVADDVHICRAETPAGPHVFVEEAEGRLDFRRLARLRLEVTAVILREGRLLLPLDATNRLRQTLCLNELHGQVRFLPGDLWDLSNLRATCLGAKLQLSGFVTNASALRDWAAWRLFEPSAEAQRPWANDLWRSLRRLHCGRAPQVSAQFALDARQPRGLELILRCTAQDVTSPWGRSSRLHSRLRLSPPRGPSAPSRMAWHVRTDDLHTPWGQAARVEADLHAEPPESLYFPTNARLTLELTAPDTRWGRAKRASLWSQLAAPEPTARRLTQWQLLAQGVQTPWVAAGQTEIKGRLDHTATNLLPATYDLTLAATALRGTNSQAHAATVHLTGALPTADRFLLFRTNLLWPERLEPLPMRATVLLTNFATPGLSLAHWAGTGHWAAPRLEAEVETAADGESATLRADLDAGTRELRLQVRADVDPRRLSSLLPTNAQAVLRDCVWQVPPHLEARAELVLPVWSRPWSEWPAALQPTLSLQGVVSARSGVCHGVEFTSLHALFAYANDQWQCRELRLSRAEGDLSGQFSVNTRTRDFAAQLRSTLDPRLLKTWLEDPDAQAFLDDFRLTEPPTLVVESTGNWGDWTRLDLRGRVAATNFVFRGEPIKDCQSAVHFTNQFLSFLAPEIRREGELGRAEGVGLDLRAQLVHLTNAVGNLSPYAIARVVGPQVVEALAPYRFDHSPTGRVWGTIDMLARGHRDQAHFELSGGPFHWRHFTLPEIAGRVHWAGQTVTITNLHGAFYEGRLAGHVRVDFSPPQGEVLAFHLRVTNVSLPGLVAAVGGKTNQLDGLLNGELTILHAHTADPRSWQGYGHVSLTNGLLWDIPIFGVFSPVLNAFVPGLGNSRARRANATFAIAQSVIHSRDLQVDATGMRMQYDLRVDFEQRIEGRVEAELLRNLPALGLVVSKVLWPVTKLFEYRLSGTLAQPKASPVFFIPRILLLPFRPLKTIEELLPEGPKKTPPSPP